MNNVSLVEIIRRNLVSSASEFRNNCLYYATEKMSVEELSAILGTTPSEIVNYFWNQEKTVGKNQYLPLAWLEDYCRSIRVKLKKKKEVSWREIITEYLTQIDAQAQLKERPPIVSIMGHVDHGKTTLLDTIRHTHLQEKEVGGITQKITVSPIEFQGKKIIFLDTPGHSDFIHMRQRGVSLTDIVVLVISARDGVMSQTEEIINYLREYRLPVIVFINHQKPIDTDNEANLSRIKSQCQDRGLTPLDWGGETIFISGNAKEKNSVNHLCENILLFSDYQTNWQRPASGVVINSYPHPRTGTMLTELLVQGGCLQEKDEIFLTGKFGLAKIIFDRQDQKIKQAFPGDLVRIIGYNFPTELGEKFLVIADEKIRKEIIKELADWSGQKSRFISPPPSEKKNINFVLLADSQNSLEALNNLVTKNDNPHVSFSVVYSAVGKLNSWGLNLAKITQSVILAFGYQFSAPESKNLRENNLPFFSSKLIYEIADQLKKISENQQEKRQVEKVMGVAQVSHVFYFSKVGNIAGCQIVSGKIARNNSVHVFRGEKQLFTGLIRSLESNKITIKEISSGRECGIVLKGFDNFQIGDKIIAFQMKEENIFATE